MPLCIGKILQTSMFSKIFCPLAECCIIVNDTMTDFQGRLCFIEMGPGHSQVRKNCFPFFHDSTSVRVQEKAPVETMKLRSVGKKGPSFLSKTRFSALLF